MAVTEGTLIWSQADGNLSDWKAFDDCTALVTADGWHGFATCGDGTRLLSTIELVNFPVPADTKIVQVTISGVSINPEAALYVSYSPNADGSNITTVIANVDSNQWSHVFAYSPGDYGTPITILCAANSKNSPGAQLYIHTIEFSTLVDDSLPTGLPTNPGPPVNTEPCIDNVTYTLGDGPECVLPLNQYTFTSNSALGQNGLEFTFDKATQITIKAFHNFDLSRVTFSTFLTIEYPIGTPVFQGLKAQITDLSQLMNTYPCKRLTIAYHAFDAPFSVDIYIGNIADGDTFPVPNPGQDYGGLLDGLNGIVSAINDEKSTLDDTIHTGLFDLKSILANISTDLPSGLVSEFFAGITGIPQAAIENLLSNIRIPPELVQDFLNFIQAIINNEGQILATFVNNLQQNTNIQLSEHIISQNNNLSDTINAQGRVINSLLSGNYSDSDSFFNDLKKAGNNIDFIEWLQNAYLTIFGTIEFLKAKTNVANVVSTQILLGEYTPNINDIQTLVTDYFKGAITLTQLQDYAKRYGLDTSKVTEIVSARRPLPNLQEIQQGLLRGIISNPQHDKYLSQYGFGPDDINFIKSLYNILPSPTDITRIADKHIFSNDIPTIFGQYTEIDQGYLDAMAKFGFSADWVQKLWAAHWSLTGLQDTFAMYHRGIINDNELNTWFALTDIMPFFREKLKELNYTLITRVDIRRFYAEGIYNEAQVTQAYKRLGFSDADAQLQTQYTVLHERDSENPAKVKIKALTETMVVKAYKRGLLSLPEAITRLGNVGYLAADAQLILELETQIDGTSLAADKTQHYHDKLLTHILASLSKGTISEDEARANLTAIGVPQAEIESEIAYSAIERVLQFKEYVENHIKTAYTSGQIEKLDAINQMSSLGFTMNEITYLFEELDLVKQLRNKALTETQIKDIYNAGVIDRDTVYTELINLGYTDKHAQWLTDTIAPQVN